MLDCGAGAAPVVGSTIFKMKHRSHGDMPPMLVGADSPVAGLVDKAYGPQWTHAVVRMAGPSLGKGMAGPLQVAGLNVSYQRVLQVVGLNVAGIAGAVQPPAAGFVGACEQPPAAYLQVAGPHISGFAGVCEQPPTVSLQVVGPHVQ